MKFFIKGFFSKCDQIHSLVTFIEEILNGKVFFCAVTVVAKRLDDYKNPGYTSTRIMLES